MEKKNTGLKVLIIVLSILVVILGGYIVYDKILNTNIDIENNDDRPINGNITINDASSYITLEDVVFNSKVSTKKVKLNNLADSITSQFYKEQQEVINSIHVSDDETFNAEYSLRYYIHDNVLSVIYTIEESNRIGTCATKKAVTNIDLVNNRVISEEELLEKAGISYSSIVKSQYDRELESWNKNNENAGFEISYYEVTFADFRDNKEKYINFGIEKLPNIIYTYVEDGKIKYDYYTIDMGSLFHMVGKGGCFNWETVTLGNF